MGVAVGDAAAGIGVSVALGSGVECTVVAVAVSVGIGVSPVAGRSVGVALIARVATGVGGTVAGVVGV